jgi:hypothetical protein
MSVNWKDTDSEARVYAYAAAMESGEFDSEGTTWSIYCDLREALIWALLATGFPPNSDWGITKKNWEQVYLRLAIWETARGCSRTYNNGDNASREVFFTPEEIRSMIGFSVNAGTKTNAEFKKFIFMHLEGDANTKLDRCVNPAKRDIDDPYRWEKMYAPTHVKEMKK